MRCLNWLVVGHKVLFNGSDLNPEQAEVFNFIVDYFNRVIIVLNDSECIELAIDCLRFDELLVTGSGQTPYQVCDKFFYDLSFEGRRVTIIDCEAGQDCLLRWGSTFSKSFLTVFLKRNDVDPPVDLRPRMVVRDLMGLSKNLPRVRF